MRRVEGARGEHGPRVTIVVPVLNQVDHLAEGLRSVLDQGHPDLELLVVDGGSTDGSVAILEEHADAITWWVSEPDAGQSDAIAKGMARATGEVVNWLNADDVLLPGALDALAAAYGQVDGPTVFVGGGALLDVDGTVLFTTASHPIDRPVLPSAPPLAGGDQAAWFLTRSAWELVGGVDRDLQFMMDIDLFHRCHEAGVTFVPVDALLAGYREHPGNKTSSRWRASIDEKSEYHRAALARLSAEDHEVYEPRVERYLASLHLNSIRPSMPLHERARRVGRAVRIRPSLLTRRNRVRRLWQLLRAQPDPSSTSS
jgi:glycosyltransferase involved in cell wall biosynthesis